MDIITVCISVLFGLVLAALAVIPDLIGIYLGLRAQRKRDALQNTSEVVATFPAPVPFNYPPLTLRETSGKAQEPSFEEWGGDDPADWWKSEKSGHA